MSLIKRKWHYSQNPVVYGIECDKCGNKNITWSEYKKHIWCYDCEVDTKGTDGIFTGPIMMGTCELMGIRFDRVYV